MGILPFLIVESFSYCRKIFYVVGTTAFYILYIAHTMSIKQAYIYIYTPNVYLSGTFRIIPSQPLLQIPDAPS